MTSPIAPGDFVECIKTGDGVVSGSIYQINRFSHCSECDNCGVTGPGLWLVGFEDYPFCPSQFKPIYRPSASLLTSLLNANALPAKQRERAEVMGPVLFPLTTEEWAAIRSARMQRDAK